MGLYSINKVKSYLFVFIYSLKVWFSNLFSDQIVWNTSIHAYNSWSTGEIDFFYYFFINLICTSVPSNKTGSKNKKLKVTFFKNKYYGRSSSVSKGVMPSSNSSQNQKISSVNQPVHSGSCVLSTSTCLVSLWFPTYPRMTQKHPAE